VADVPEPLTADELQDLILTTINDDGTVKKKIDRLWRMYQPWSNIMGVEGLYSLQYLKVQAHACLILMGRVRYQLTYSARDRRTQLSDLFAFLKAMRQETLDEIKESQDSYGGDGLAVVSQFEVVLPNYDDLIGCYDPSDSYYAGDPQKRRFPYIIR
jgi:hypothetical protein